MDVFIACFFILLFIFVLKLKAKALINIPTPFLNLNLCRKLSLFEQFMRVTFSFFHENLVTVDETLTEIVDLPLTVRYF